VTSAGPAGERTAGERAARLLRWYPRAWRDRYGAASGHSDPFYPGVQAFARALPERPGGVPAVTAFSNGCHAGPFFTAQEPPSLAFLAQHLSAALRPQRPSRSAPR
jgi:hypothetical protein